MSKVMSGFSVSLDGFIAHPDDNPKELFEWFYGGDTEVTFPDGQMVLKVSPESAAHFRGLFQQIGALVTGRRQFDLTHGWGGRHPLDVPVFVVTHSVPEGWPREGKPFTFVTDGVESAIEQAKAVAGEKNVAVDGASIAQQAIKAGLVDEIGIDLVPILLGEGVRYFDNLGSEPIRLERTSVVVAPGVTHIRFRVVDDGRS